MTKRIIDIGTNVGSYSSAVQAGGHLYISGTGGFLPGTTDIAPGGIDAEIRQTLTNLRDVLTEAGYSFSDVVSTTCYLTDPDDWPLLNKIYLEYFSAPLPARAALTVGAMPLGAKVEITAIAWKEAA